MNIYKKNLINNNLLKIFRQKKKGKIYVEGEEANEEEEVSEEEEEEEEEVEEEDHEM